MNKLNIWLIALLVVLGTGCKKVYNYHCPEKQLTENTDITVEYIKSNTWTIVDSKDDKNGSVLIWKLQVKGTNNYLTIDKAPPEKYWQPAYQVGAKLDGYYVSTLNISR